MLKLVTCSIERHRNFLLPKFAKKLKLYIRRIETYFLREIHEVNASGIAI